MIGDKVKRQIKSIDKLSIECNRCGTEIIMNIDVNNTAHTPYQCCGCGLDFEIDKMDDLYGRLQSLLTSARRSKLQAKFSLICEEEIGDKNDK